MWARTVFCAGFGIGVKRRHQVETFLINLVLGRERVVDKGEREWVRVEHIQILWENSQGEGEIEDIREASNDGVS